MQPYKFQSAIHQIITGTRYSTGYLFGLPSSSVFKQTLRLVFRYSTFSLVFTFICYYYLFCNLEIIIAC